ncbi:MAG TPA: hypothetical protein VEU08_16770 [Vicinamibacterales bacterium]|nr:hypothetical protein [Vicinamibacterales bacterium]
MRKWFVCGLAVGALGFAGSAMIAAPAQKYPGQPTDARVWIENRTKPEAIAISVQDVASDAYMNVRVTSMPPVTIEKMPAVTVAGGVERRRQAWQYQTLLVRPGQDIAAELNRAGSDSWEATGSQTQDSNGILFIMKRPK